AAGERARRRGPVARRGPAPPWRWRLRAGGAVQPQLTDGARARERCVPSGRRVGNACAWPAFGARNFRGGYSRPYGPQPTALPGARGPFAGSGWIRLAGRLSVWTPGPAHHSRFG